MKKCPKCESELVKGYFVSQRRISWSEKKYNGWWVRKKDMDFEYSAARSWDWYGTNVLSYMCRKCRTIVTKY